MDLLWVVPFRAAYIVGVVGHRFAGTSTALSYLSEKRGFHVYTLAGVLREFALARGIPLEPRRRLQDLGDELRTENADGAYLARLVLRRIRRDHLSHRVPSLPSRIAVTGFKHPDEATIFQQLGRFHMIVVDSHPRVRFNRGRREGVIQSELRQLEVFAPERLKPLRPTFENFVAYIDDRDRRGVDRIAVEISGGRDDRRPWVRAGSGRRAALFDQQVDNVLAASQREGVDFRVDNGRTERSRLPKARLFADLSKLVDRLDGSYRSVGI